VEVRLVTAFAYELATVLRAQEQARPGDPEGAYAMPWYLVIGTPGSGRTTAIKALSMSWPYGDTAIPMNLPEQLCTYWMPEKALFIEPEAVVVGPNRTHGKLQELCTELKDKRPREPIDGIVLVVSAQQLADSTDDAVEELAKELRRYLIEVAQALAADVPVYVVVTAYDALWGFGDAFKWTPERRDEEPWGFALRLDVPPAEAPDHVKQELEGLGARIESMCFAKLADEDPAEVRARAFQHLLEARALLRKLTDFMHIIAMANAFERAPWVRALVLGSGTPGTGNQLRYYMAELTSMGLQAPAASGTPQPGGMPMHALIDAVLLPERDLVPTRVRWRDDILLIILLIGGILAWIALIVVMVIS
jgi:type VI protein secretion system component VasK